MPEKTQWKIYKKPKIIIIKISENELFWLGSDRFFYTQTLIAIFSSVLCVRRLQDFEQNEQVADELLWKVRKYCFAFQIFLARFIRWFAVVAWKIFVQYCSMKNDEVFIKKSLAWIQMQVKAISSENKMKKGSFVET